MSSEVLLDISGLVAWAWGHDEVHRMAKERWQSLLDSKTPLIVSRPILIQFLSVLQEAIHSPCQAREVAILVGKQLRYFEEYDYMRTPDVTEAQMRDAWQVFDEAKVAEMTFSDCLCVAIARRRKISDVFSSQRFYREFQLSPLLASEQL